MSMAVYKDGWHDGSPKLVSKKRSIVQVINHNGSKLADERGPTKNSKYTPNKPFPKMIFVSLGGSYHSDECSSVCFFVRFGFNQLIDAIKTRSDVMSDCSLCKSDQWPCWQLGQTGYWWELNTSNFLISTAQTLAPNDKYGSIHIWNIWLHFVHPKEMKMCRPSLYTVYSIITNSEWEQPEPECRQRRNWFLLHIVQNEKQFFWK